MHDKEKYVMHIINQQTWLKKYTDQDFFDLINNSVFGENYVKWKKT